MRSSAQANRRKIKCPASSIDAASPGESRAYSMPPSAHNKHQSVLYGGSASKKKRWLSKASWIIGRAILGSYILA
jgi:hypothetical protein